MVAAAPAPRGGHLTGAPRHAPGPPRLDRAARRNGGGAGRGPDHPGPALAGPGRAGRHRGRRRHGPEPVDQRRRVPARPAPAGRAGALLGHRTALARRHPRRPRPRHPRRRPGPAGPRRRRPHPTRRPLPRRARTRPAGRHHRPRCTRSTPFPALEPADPDTTPPDPQPLSSSSRRCPPRSRPPRWPGPAPPSPPRGTTTGDLAPRSWVPGYVTSRGLDPAGYRVRPARVDPHPGPPAGGRVHRPRAARRRPCPAHQPRHPDRPVPQPAHAPHPRHHRPGRGFRRPRPPRHHRPPHPEVRQQRHHRPVQQDRPAVRAHPRDDHPAARAARAWPSSKDRWTPSP